MQFLEGLSGWRHHHLLFSSTLRTCPFVQFLEGLSGWRRRWTMVLLCFVAFMLCNMDRVNMSIAVLPMAQQYGWSTQTVGLVQSSFFW
jgi:ACS family sodium-dependent inorganic phosphate cotransporter